MRPKLCAASVRADIVTNCSSSLALVSSLPASTEGEQHYQSNLSKQLTACRRKMACRLIKRSLCRVVICSFHHELASLTRGTTRSGKRRGESSDRASQSLFETPSPFSWAQPLRSLINNSSVPVLWVVILCVLYFFTSLQRLSIHRSAVDRGAGMDRKGCFALLPPSGGKQGFLLTTKAFSRTSSRCRDTKHPGLRSPSQMFSSRSSKSSKLR